MSCLLQGILEPCSWDNIFSASYACVFIMPENRGFLTNQILYCHSTSVRYLENYPILNPLACNTRTFWSEVGNVTNHVTCPEWITSCVEYSVHYRMQILSDRSLYYPYNSYVDSMQENHVPNICYMMIIGLKKNYKSLFCMTFWMIKIMIKINDINQLI